MPLQKFPNLVRLFPALSLVGICATGILLYLLHSAVVKVQRVDFEYTKTFSLIDELRNELRTLTELVYRATSYATDTEVEKDFQRILDMREGLLARPASSLVAPGIRVSFASLVNSLPLTPTEHRLLLQAYSTSQAISAQEQKAIGMAARIGIDDMADPAAREIVRQAIALVNSPEYKQQIADIQRNLGAVLQSITDRMREENTHSHRYMNILMLGICLTIFITMGSLTVLAYVGRMPYTSRGKVYRARRIYLYIVLLLTLAFAVPIGLIYTDARNILVNALEKRQALICNEVYSELRLRTTQALELVQIIAIRPPIRAFLQTHAAKPQHATAAYEKALEVLHTFISNYSDMGSSLLLDAEGTILISPTTAFTQGTQNFLSPNALARVLNGESFITTIPNPATGEEELIAATPVFATYPARDSVIGAVVAIMDRRNSFRLWEGRLAAEENMNIFILNNEAKVILSSRGIEHVGRPALYEGAAHLVQQGAQGLQYYRDGQGVERIGFFRSMPELGWTVAATSSYVTLTADVREMLMRAGLFAMITILATILLFSLLIQRMTASLRDANQHLFRLMECGQMGCWVIDSPKGTFSGDAAWQRMLNYPEPVHATEIPLPEHHAQIHPEDMERASTYAANSKVGDYVTLEARIRNYEGEWRWHRATGIVEEVNAEGFVTHMSGFSMDITAQKLLESSQAALLAANQRMDNIVNSAGMFTYDLDVISGTIAHNAQWCHFWQYSGPAQAGIAHISFVLEKLYPESLPVFCAVMEHQTEGNTFTIDFQLHTCTGESRWCRQIGRIESCDEHGKPTRIIGTGFDITAQKIAEKSAQWYSRQLEETVIQRTAELEESRNQAQAASQAKTAFLSTVSHEIRTPMNAIVGFAHIFDRSNLTRSQKGQLEKIKLSAAALLGVINDVLDISKIEAGKLEIEHTPFCLHTLLNTVCGIVDFATTEKNLDLNINVAKDVPESFVGDPKRISQILLNLMNNAVKFTSEGSISLTVGLDTNPPPDDTKIMLAFSVTDTGIGLSPEQIGRLFKPFMQADSSVTRRFGGTGLGLAISRQLVELMGGSIGVRSELGQGSTFYFNLCLDKYTYTGDHPLQCDDTMGPANASSTEHNARLQSLHGAQVLVVEDNDINREIAAALLQELGIEVDMACNGVQALSMAVEKHYRCIFMDMQMPIMGGLEAAQRLRAMGAEAQNDPHAPELQRWLAQIPIIAMTANAMAEDRQHCLDAGMNDHISKPIEPETLQRCLLQWLDK